MKYKIRNVPLHTIFKEFAVYFNSPLQHFPNKSGHISVITLEFNTRQ